MKPIKVLLFFLTVYTALLVVAVFFPEDGIKISENLKLRFFNPTELVTSDTIEYPDISNRIDQNERITDSVLDAMPQEIDSEVYDTIKANADSLSKSIFRIQFPKNNTQCLHSIFKALHNVKKGGKLIRIMHYGDSQIEGDRITSYIRYRLQKRFGGFGIGLVPIEHVYNFKFSIEQENSDNWHRYVVYGEIDTTLKHSRYGVLGTFCTFTDNLNDTLITEEDETEAWISFNESKLGYSNTRKFQRCRVFYGYNREPFLYQTHTNETLIEADIIPVNNSVKMLNFKFDQPVSNLKFTFKGRHSPEFYGVSLDSPTGVAVDNIAMRGCAGTIFTHIDKNVLQTMYNELNVKLFILQFGGNVVPYLTKNFSFYENRFYYQIKRLQSICPNASIIVIGVSDMSTKIKNRFVTYPNLESIRDALKSASFKAGAAYWDMYEAMGGYNSMPSWVFAQPPLASTDYVHFNPKGAKIIAKMFYNAFIYEYNRFENNMRK